MTTTGFGWRVPDFPTDGSDIATFLTHIMTTLDAIRSTFDSAWVADHVVPWASWQPVTSPTVECWTTLTFLAARYPELTWGPIVLCQSYRNPALLAKMVAQLCAFAPGKIVFGIGAGWKDDEYRAYDWPFPSPATRIRQLAETVEIARKLWTEDDVTYTGRHYTVTNAFLNPKPDPLPPVMIGGGGEQLTLKVVARHADWWNLPGGTQENYVRKLALLDDYCREIVRDPSEIQRTWSCEVVAIGDSEAEAQRMAERSPFYRGAGLVGTPEQVVEQVQAWKNLGVSHFQLRFADFPRLEAIQRFASEILPHVR